MEKIIHWMTQIVLYLLLVTMIDLILPNQTMKRYVKLVTGLILILIFLKPLFSLSSLDLQQEIEQAFMQSQTESFNQHIPLKKIDFEASQRDYIFEKMSEQLMVLANPSLIEQHGVEITHIEFVFQDEQTFTYETLEELIVHMKDHETTSQLVSPVEEIVIFQENDGEKNHDLELDHIKILLTELWEIENVQLTILWGGGTVER